MAFNVEEPRDTHGRWIRLGRGELEKLVHAAVDARAHDIAAQNGHGEEKAQQIQAHLRRQALAKIPAAPVYNVKVSDHHGRAMQLDINAAGAPNSRRITIPHRKLSGNLEQRDIMGAPKPEQVDRPDVHSQGRGTEVRAEAMRAAGAGTETQAGMGYGARGEFNAGIREAAHEAAQAERQRRGSGEATAMPEQQARQMEAAGAGGRVGLAAAKKAAELIRGHGGADNARKTAKGAAKKALDQEFGTPQGMGSVEKAMLNSPIERLKNKGRMGGIAGDKYSGYINGKKMFIKTKAGAYKYALRDGVRAGRFDGPPERGAYLVGNVMGMDGGINGRMPAVVIRHVPDLGEAMLKEMVPGDPNAGRPSPQYKRDNLWYAFDAAIGNLDRHGGNHIRSTNGHDYYPVDHGLAFPDDGSHSGLDRGLYDAWGLALQPNEKQALEKLVANKEQLQQQLIQSGLSEREVSSFWGRVHGMLGAGRFPRNIREAAEWGRPGRVEGQPADVVRIERLPGAAARAGVAIPAGGGPNFRNAVRRAARLANANPNLGSQVAAQEIQGLRALVRARYRDHPQHRARLEVLTKHLDAYLARHRRAA